MKRALVDIVDEGPHVVIPAVSGQRILIHKFVLSFAHPYDESQPAIAMAGSTVIEGYLVYDGEKIFWSRDPNDTMRIPPSTAFSIKLADGVKCMGFIEYDEGIW